MNKEEAKQKVAELIDKFKEIVDTGQFRKYSEEETKKDFILPLFEALGWKVYSRNDVSAEETISGNRVDYGFYLDGRIQFYLEAKAAREDLNKEKFANQAVQYSWNKGVTWAILTDFESIKIFNAQDIDASLGNKLFKDISYTDFLLRFDELWLLSKEAFKENQLDKEAEKHGKKQQKISVTKKLYDDLNQARELLTNRFLAWNEDLKKDRHLVDEGVQKVLDRIIFIRVAEDRKIESPILRPLVREWKIRWDNGKRDKLLYQYMIEKFREFDSIYNSHIFAKHSSDEWEEQSNTVEGIIEKLYGQEGYYEYDFKAMSADVLGTVYEQYLGHKLSQALKGDLFGTTDVILAKDSKKRKQQGIYYTPAFIVDYIVQNALGPALEKCKSITDLQKIKVLDPACGSGSFLIKAFDAIYKKYDEFGSSGQEVKLQILVNNLYGVDLDEQAIEIARLNLLVAALEERRKLPNLTNIKNGNSLISGSDEELENQFGKNWRDKKAFNWQEQFPEVFKQGGFDVIIGNPPYIKELDSKELFQKIKKSNFGMYYQGKMDFWYFFLHRSIEILKDNGIMAFITNSYFLKSVGATKLINHLQDETVLTKAVDFQDIPIFESVSGRHLIHIWKKTKNKNMTTKYIKLNKATFYGIIDENKYIELPYTEVIKNSSISFEINTHNIKNTLLLGDLYDISQGVVEGPDKVSQKNGLKYGLQKGKGVFIVNGEELDKLNLNKKERLYVKKYLDTKNVSKYSISHGDEYLLYINKENCSDISKYPNLEKHLVKFRKIMDNRRETLNKSNQWFQMHWPRDNKYFESPKLICKGMFLSPEFCFDDQKYYVGFSFSVIIQKDKNYDLKYLLGLIHIN